MLGSPGQGEEGTEPSLPLPPAAASAFFGEPGVSVPFPSEAEEAADAPFDLGLSLLSTGCCYGYSYGKQGAL